MCADQIGGGGFTYGTFNECGTFNASCLYYSYLLLERSNLSPIITTFLSFELMKAVLVCLFCQQWKVHDFVLLIPKHVHRGNRRKSEHFLIDKKRKLRVHTTTTLSQSHRYIFAWPRQKAYHLSRSSLSLAGTGRALLTSLLLLLDTSSILARLNHLLTV